MRYLSPYSLPDSAHFDPSDKKALALQRKKLLAEWELSGEGFLFIKNRPFSKSEILDYFETLQDARIVYYHTEVGKDEALVAFLEEQTAGETLFAKTAIYEDDQFLEWISPYFYEAFVGYTTRCLQNDEEDWLQVLMQNPLLMTGYDREGAWIEISQVFENNISKIDHYCRRLERNNAAPVIDEISSLVSGPVVSKVLLFPEEAFPDVRDRYAWVIMEASIIIFNKVSRRRDLADEWMENARVIAVSTEMKNSVSDKILEMHTIREGKTNSFSTRVAIFIGIIVVKILIGQFGSSSYQRTPVFTNFRYINGKDTTILHNPSRLDTLFHAGRRVPDSAQPLRLR